MTTTRVVIIGGGYAGALAANRLRKNPDVRITLVNPRPHFVERIRLHQLVAGTGDATIDMASMLGDDVELVVDSAVRIDAAGRRVELESGAGLSYDYLLYAVGSTGAVPAVPGAEFAYSISELEDAQRLRNRVLDIAPPAPIVVVGGGLTGVEAASEFAEDGRAVTLVCGPILAPSAGKSGRKSLRKQLRKLRVTVREGISVAGLDAETVTLTDGSVLPSAATVWTAGFGVPGLAAASGLSTDALGRLITDETLTSVDDPFIVAAGDAASPSEQPLRMSCQAALPLGAQAAETVLSRIAGTEPKNVDQAFTGQCISVGRRFGTIQLARRDDSTIPLYVGGRAAATVKEAVCKGTISFITREKAKPGTYFWLKAGKRAARSAGQARSTVS